MSALPQGSPEDPPAAPAVGRVLLVSPYHQLAWKAAAAGVRVWSMGDSGRLDTAFVPRLREASQELLLADFSDEPALRRLIAQTVRKAGIGTVLHCGDGDSVLPVVEEAWRLGVSPNPPGAVARLLSAGAAARPAVAGGDRDAAVPRVSVQTLTVASRHHVVGVTLHRTGGAPGHATTGYLHPAPLPAAVLRAAEKTAVELLTASGYRCGPAVTELALPPAGPRVLSCGTHLGPSRVPLLVEVAREFDLETALFEALAGRAPEVPPVRRYAELGFFLLPEGELRTYAGLDTIAVTPWVRGARFPHAVGELVPPPGDPAARRGYVVVEGDSPERVQARIRQARADLITTIRPVPATDRTRPGRSRVPGPLAGPDQLQEPEA
ncbi:phosphoribosylglycinamide synthetase [Streptomyces monticola]|uniref:Phosphoribosylglycinamide synthetase n=1 Tax=Streptomyces monticola TaxID=2666263 RepID=A0ABW2JCB4_9ACTN